MMGLSSSTPLPMMTTLACLGAALIIASSETGLSLVGGALSNRLLVFVGKISYSLYLWHWLFIAFQNSDSFLFERSDSIETKLGLIAASVLTAYLSWRFIETPFRRWTPDTSLARVFGGAFASIGLIIFLAAAALGLDGAQYRFPHRVNTIASYLGYDPGVAFRAGRCYLSTNRQIFNAGNCLTKVADKKNYLLVGDSHAAHLWLGLQRSLPDVNVMQASATMCRPVMREYSWPDTRACGKLMHYVFDDYLARERVDEVLLSASWKEEDLPALSNTVDRLIDRGLKVIVMGPIVEYRSPTPPLARRRSTPGRRPFRRLPKNRGRAGAGQAVAQPRYREGRPVCFNLRRRVWSRTMRDLRRRRHTLAIRRRSFNGGRINEGCPSIGRRQGVAMTLGVLGRLFLGRICNMPRGRLSDDRQTES